MPRKARDPALVAEVQMNTEVVREDLHAADQLVRFDQEAASRVRVVAAQLGYQLPADCTDPDLIQRDISINMRRSVEACLEVGRGLRVLKEACEHGQFIARLDVLGIDRKVAAKFMQAAVKFANVSSTRHLTAALGSQTKLFEMLVLDDEQLEELELTGQTGELKLDDVATMSVKELRVALREARDIDVAKSRMLAEKNAKLDELAAKKPKRPHATPWPMEIEGLKDDLHGLGKIADEVLGKHLLLVDATEIETNKLDPDQDADRPAFEAYKTVIHQIGEQIERLCTLAAGLRNQYELRLGGYIEIDKTYILPE